MEWMGALAGGGHDTTCATDPVVHSADLGDPTAINHIILIVLFFMFVIVCEVFFVNFGGSPIVGQILAGFCYGPAWWNLLQYPLVYVYLGEIGVLVLTLESGLAVTVRKAVACGSKALLMGLVGGLAPLALTFLLYGLPFGLPWKETLVIGAAMVPTSLGFSAQLLKEFNILTSKNGNIIIFSAVVDDVLSLVLLAMIQELTKPQIEGSIGLLLGLPVVISIGFILFCTGLAILFERYLAYRLETIHVEGSGVCLRVRCPTPHFPTKCDVVPPEIRKEVESQRERMHQDIARVHTLTNMDPAVPPPSKEAIDDVLESSHPPLPHEMTVAESLMAFKGGSRLARPVALGKRREEFLQRYGTMRGQGGEGGPQSLVSGGGLRSRAVSRVTSGVNSSLLMPSARTGEAFARMLSGKLPSSPAGNAGRVDWRERRRTQDENARRESLGLPPLASGGVEFEGEGAAAGAFGQPPQQQQQQRAAVQFPPFPPDHPTVPSSSFPSPAPAPPAPSPHLDVATGPAAPGSQSQQQQQGVVRRETWDLDVPALEEKLKQQQKEEARTTKGGIIPGPQVPPPSTPLQRGTSGDEAFPSFRRCLSGLDQGGWLDYHIRRPSVVYKKPLLGEEGVPASPGSGDEFGGEMGGLDEGGKEKGDGGEGGEFELDDEQEGLPPGPGLQLFILSLAAVFLGWAAAVVKSSALLGVFMAGMIFSTVPSLDASWRVYATPLVEWGARLFFAGTIGLLMPKLNELVTAIAFGKGILLFFVGTLGKVFCGFFSHRLCFEEFLTTAAIMNGRGEIAFLILQIAGGILTDDDRAATVWALILQCVTTPYMVRLAAMNAARSKVGSAQSRRKEKKVGVEEKETNANGTNGDGKSFRVNGDATHDSPPPQILPITPAEP